MTNQQKREATWTTRDGTVLRVQDMSTEHLRNAQALMRRKMKQRRPEMEREALLSAASAGGEMASYYAINSAEALTRMSDDDLCLIAFGEAWTAVYNELCTRETRALEETNHDQA